MIFNDVVVSGADLGPSLAYRFDGDSVHLHADVRFEYAVATQHQDCRLQLWASPVGFAEGLQGVIVAELPVQPLPGLSTVDAWVCAQLPAGMEQQVMALALVSAPADGERQLHALSVFPDRESFCLPRMQGEVSCVLADGEATLMLEQVSNPRATDNLSGTLALEVWSLDAPYAGGAFSGQTLASVVLGVLPGAAQWNDCRYCVPAATPAPGRSLTVMLREWTSSGYLTRDFRNLPQPVTTAVAEPAVVEAPVAEAVIEAEVSPKVVPRLLPINLATEAELTSVKGITAKLARAIIVARPFESYDQVLAIKGIGQKLLKKLRSALQS